MNSHHENNNQQAQHNQAQKRDSDRPGRAQLKQVLLDVNFKDKPKVLDLEDAFGALARLLLIDIVSSMSAATEGEISRGAIRRLGSRIGFDADKTNEITNWCVKHDLITELPTGLLTNRRVVADQESLFKKQERWRKAKGIQPDSARNGEGRHAEGARKSEQLKTEDLNIEDLKEIGLIKVGQYVHLTEISREALRKRFLDEQMDEKAIARAVEYLDKDFHVNPEKRTSRDNFLELVGWPLDKVRLEKAKLERQKAPFKKSQEENPGANRARKPAAAMPWERPDFIPETRSLSELKKIGGKS